MSWSLSLKFRQRIVILNVAFLFLIISIIIYFQLKSQIKCLKYYSSNTGKTQISNIEPVVVIPFTKNDSFNDLEGYLKQLRSSNIISASFKQVIIPEKVDLNNSNFADVMRIDTNDTMTFLKQFQLLISKQEVYRENDTLVDNVINDMANLPIQSVSWKKYGTQLKFTIDFGDDIKALFKPERLTIDEETDPNHYYFQVFERHNSEIAAFHLDRALNFRRTMPVVGRRFNITSDLYDLATDDMRKTFFTSPANNKCFYGKCVYYCSILEPVCGSPDIIQGSLAAYLPEFKLGVIWSFIHPWRRTYTTGYKAHWETNPDYCEIVKKQPLYSSGRKLLDVMDLIVFDFLMGNLDRHHFEYVSIWANKSINIHLDNGRGFGKAFEDDMSILTGIIQCCLIRETTLKRLLMFHNGPKPLSQIMRESLSKDPLAPVLAEKHLIALDRRVQIILQQVRSCVKKVEDKGQDIILNDIF